MSLNRHEIVRRLERCKHCGKRIFQANAGKYAVKTWLHYGYALSDCDGLVAKYATPGENREEQNRHE